MQNKRFGLRGRAAMLALLVGVLGLAGSARAAQTIGNFSYGQLLSATVGATGCGTNAAGEPAIHVSRTNNVFLGSELGVGSGSELWRGLGAIGGAVASGCSLEYRGQPNAVSGTGASGGDIDVAIASAKNASGNYNLYVSSLNLASVNVATRTSGRPIGARLVGLALQKYGAYVRDTAGAPAVYAENLDVKGDDWGGLLNSDDADMWTAADFEVLVHPTLTNV